jgi:hypothetical protein
MLLAPRPQNAKDRTMKTTVFNNLVLIVVYYSQK